MPPKKKQRLSPEADTSTPGAPTPIPDNMASPRVEEPDSELWTDEEESSLFKGMIRWKPVGMHKRFRMISLSQHMRAQGHTAIHTRPEGIREKLDGLYNMKMLDERENATTDDLDPDERFAEFRLPAEEFYGRMMEKRVDVERESSPEDAGEVDGEEDNDSENESEEPNSSRASSVRGRRGGRRGRGARGARGGRGRGKDTGVRGRAKAEIEASDEDEEEEDDEEEDDDEEAEEEDEAEEDEDDDEDDEDDAPDAPEDAPTPRGTRGRGRARGAARGSRGAGRRGGRKRG